MTTAAGNKESARGQFPGKPSRTGLRAFLSSRQVPSQC
jgi:hypothetical protein